MMHKAAYEASESSPGSAQDGKSDDGYPCLAVEKHLFLIRRSAATGRKLLLRIEQKNVKWMTNIVAKLAKDGDVVVNECAWRFVLDKRECWY